MTIKPSEKANAQVNGLELRYIDFGGEGAPCLLLHGATGYAGSWALWRRRTGLPLRCVALEQRGHGDSDKPDSGYSALDFGHDAAVFWDQLGLGPAVVIGASMGGNTALAMAAERPDLVRAIILSDPAYKTPPEWHAESEDGIRTAAPEFATWDDVVAAIEARGVRWPRDMIEAYYRPNLKRTESGGLAWRYSRSALLQVWEHFRDNLRGLAGRVEAPTLIIQAGERRVFPDASARELHETLSNSTLVTVEGAAHAVHIDKQDEFDGHARRFLSELGVL